MAVLTSILLTLTVLVSTAILPPSNSESASPPYWLEKNKLQGSSIRHIEQPVRQDAVTPFTAVRRPPNEEKSISNAITFGEEELSASNVFVVDSTNDMLLFTENADVQRSPASTTKIITAIVVVRNVALDEIVIIQQEDLVDSSIFSNAGLQAGDELTVRDLLVALMLPSGGDAANALARHTGSKLVSDPGQQGFDRFIREMNITATEIGMTDSYFLNAMGNDEPGHVSTARDLAIAANELFQFPVLEEIVALPQSTIQVNGSNARSIELTNTNLLIPAERVHGVKTGTTPGAGESLVLATRRADARILIVILGSTSRYQDVQRVLNRIDQEIAWFQPGGNEDVTALNTSLDRFQAEVAIQRSTPVLREQLSLLRYELDLGPRPEGTNSVLPWGNVVFFIGDEFLIGLPVIERN